MKQIDINANGLSFPALIAGQGDPVLLLHGFPDCYQNWSGQVSALADAGFCTIAPALRGYAPGCQPSDGDYSLHAAVHDVLGMVDELGGCVNLVGHDWGAAVGYLACAASPERIASFSALAIPPLNRLLPALLHVPEQLLLSGYMNFFQLPRVPEWLLRQDEFHMIEWLWRHWSPDWEPGEALQLAKATLAEPGVLSAALSWYRHLPRFWTPAHRTARQWMKQPLDVPVQVLLGKKDGCMSPRLLEHTIHPDDFEQGVRVEEVAGAGHFLHLERPDRVNSLLIQHIRRCDEVV